MDKASAIRLSPEIIIRPPLQPKKEDYPRRCRIGGKIDLEFERADEALFAEMVAAGDRLDAELEVAAIRLETEIIDLAVEKTIAVNVLRVINKKPLLAQCYRRLNNPLMPEFSMNLIWISILRLVF